jgi:hypothetical protein
MCWSCRAVAVVAVTTAVVVAVLAATELGHPKPLALVRTL